MLPPEPATNQFKGGDRVFLGAILAIAFVVGLRGILHLGYIGQDFDGPEGHHNLIRIFPEGYSYRLTNPPGLYWLGNLFVRHVTETYYLECLALFFLAINLAGLWLLFGVIWEMIASRPLRYAAAALITLVPFRAIHSVVIASDAVTVPIFAVIVVLSVRLFRSPRSVAGWAALSASLSVALVFKYTFVGVLGAVAVLLAVRSVRELNAGERVRWLPVAGLALAMPAALFWFEMRESAKVAGITTSGHWKEGAESVMRWQDILTVRKSDREIFSAPEYFRDRVYEYRKFNYGALLHLTAFTDSQNLFQGPAANPSAGGQPRARAGFLRERSARAQRLSEWSVAWCVPLTLLAIFGTLAGGALAAHALIFPPRARVSPTAVVAAALAAGFYAPIFFSLPHLGDPYTAGYWLPRLVLPSLLIFLVLGLMMVDLAFRQSARLEKAASTVCLAHVTVACGLFVGLLG